MDSNRLKVKTDHARTSHLTPDLVVDRMDPLTPLVTHTPSWIAKPQNLNSPRTTPFVDGHTASELKKLTRESVADSKASEPALRRIQR